MKLRTGMGLVAVLALAVCMVGCGGGSDGGAGGIVGTWAWSKIVITGNNIPGGRMEYSASSLPAGFDASGTISFNADGSITASGSGSAGGQSSSGTGTGSYTVSGSELTVTHEGQSGTVTYEVSGNTLRLIGTGADITEAAAALGETIPAMYTIYLSGLTITMEFSRQ